MKITEDLQTYLVLNKLDASGREKLKSKLANLSYFEVSESTYVVVSEYKANDVAGLVCGSMPPGSVNVIGLPNAELMGVETGSHVRPPFYPDEYPTVFDKTPKAGGTGDAKA